MDRLFLMLRVTVKDGERAFLMRNGRFEQVLAPGRHRMFDPLRGLAVELQHAVNSLAFRVYVNGDLVGVELCAAAKNVIALSQQLIAQHAGEVPRDREALEALPGVGRKTANVVLNMAFAQETFAVDTHVFRVGNRTYMAPGKTPFEVETRLDAIVPAPYRIHAHHWLILHGRYTCKAQRPLCEKCVINDLCRWPEKTTFMG